MSLQHSSCLDHRQLGHQMELFFFDDSAPGMPYFLPRGMSLRQNLLALWRQLNAEYGYQEIASPILNKERLWQRSGHLDFYREEMFALDDGGEGNERWFLKPMNCANAMVLFEQRRRSYRELPLRIADGSPIHRKEPSGASLGILRSRCFCIDDSHSFCESAQVLPELRRVLQLAKKVFAACGVLDRLKCRIALRPEQRLGADHEWEWCEQLLQQSAQKEGWPFELLPGEGAFYGPKIELHLDGHGGKSWQCGSIQVDVQMPKRLNLQYQNSAGEMESPVMLHKAIFGSIERFIGVWLEQCNGWLPFWSAPVQIMVIPVTERHAGSAEELAAKLRQCALMDPVKHNYLRAQAALPNQSVGAQVRQCIEQRIPGSIILGDAELAQGIARLRLHDGREREISLGWPVERLEAELVS